jgi:hypothetical protein
VTGVPRDVARPLSSGGRDQPVHPAPATSAKTNETKAFLPTPAFFHAVAVGTDAWRSPSPARSRQKPSLDKARTVATAKGRFPRRTKPQLSDLGADDTNLACGIGMENVPTAHPSALRAISGDCSVTPGNLTGCSSSADRIGQRGYRLDHVFAAPSLNAIECEYLHDFRAAGLSDHAPIEVQFDPQGDARHDYSGGLA